MKIIKITFFICCLSVFLFACKRNSLKVNISNSKKDIEFVHFDDELFSVITNDTINGLAKLRNLYPGFFDLFTYKIIRVGGIGNENFMELMSRFTNDTLIRNVKTVVDEEFSDFNKIEKQINKLFKYFQYHFPEKQLPTVYVYVSGFNQSVVTAENTIGISLDKYLGRDCSYYQQLSTTPQYKVKNMHKNKIASDVAYGWGVTEFEVTNIATNILGNIIHQGKLMYFVDALLPEMHDSLKIGYTTKQLNWCIKNEAQMWTYLIEEKMLYSTKRMDIIRYTNDGPTTSGFPIESPSRTGIWIGWQIVRQYMKLNPEITLAELMRNTDYQKILSDSKYFPK